MEIKLNISFDTGLQILFFFIAISLLFLIIKLKFRENTNYRIIYGSFRTRRGLEIMEKNSNKKLFRILEKIIIPLGVLMIFSMLALLIWSLFKQQVMVVPVIPGADYGSFKLPFFEVIIAIFISALIHEMMHGIYVYKYNLSLKSWGFFFLGPFVGAFVEPDEKELERLDNKRKFIIFAAGSVGNLILSIIVLVVYLLLAVAFSYMIVNYKSFFDPKIKIISVEENSPAYQSGIKPSYLISINGERVYFIQDVRNVISKYKPGDVITVETSDGIYNVTLGDRNGRAYMGIIFTEEYTGKEIISFILSVLFWIAIISLGLGLANMMPIFPLDGGRGFLALMEMITDKKKAWEITKIVTILSIFIILFNFYILFL